MLVSASLKEKRGIKIKVVSGVHYIIIDGATGESTWTLYLDSIITKLEQLCVCNNTIESLDPWEWLRGQEQKGQGGHIVRPGQGTWPEAEHGYASKWYSGKWRRKMHVTTEVAFDYQMVWHVSLAAKYFEEQSEHRCASTMDKRYNGPSYDENILSGRRGMCEDEVMKHRTVGLRNLFSIVTMSHCKRVREKDVIY